ncbi:MAG: aminotransferase class V-fold PLP-dependent enzyme, partial [Candidatus Rehaiarchaeum fermentans]|nr:aminotransferase class V-fold PLP-dependent enzyme [Candidatus Rehaiarchaeum fermentans]
MFDVEEIRKDFPILRKEINGKKLIYFDNAATTQKPREVIEGIKFFYENINANPIRSLHYLAEKATEAYN